MRNVDVDNYHAVGVSVIAVDGARAYVQPLLLILDQPDAILIVNVSPGMHLHIQNSRVGFQQT